MRRLPALLLCLCLIALFIGPASARDTAKLSRRSFRALSNDDSPAFADQSLRALYETAAVDTYCIVWYNFEPKSWQGWTRVDNTAQADTFFHVDDFAGLGGGSFGGLVPLDGAKSMWCGARASSSDPYVCSWENAPGYGNNWDQSLQTAAFSFVGSITFSYRLAFDSEPGYDFTSVEYDAGGGNWQRLADYTGYGDTVAVHVLTITQAMTKLRFRFTSDVGWSDQDGLYNTDGACIVDNIGVRDMAALNDFEDFEGTPVGSVAAGIWLGRPYAGFGRYSGLKSGLVDKDPCGENFTTQVVFFIGSPNPSSSYPGLYDTPFCMGSGGVAAPCQDEMVVSPVIDMTRYSSAQNNVQDGTIPPADLSLLGGAELRYTVYRDLPYNNLVMFYWHVRSVGGGCPGRWLDDGFIYFGPSTDYVHKDQDVSTLIGAGEPVQIAFGCIDACASYYLILGNCAAHTPSPYIDNVRLYRYKTAGPQWKGSYVRFGDAFPVSQYNIESYIRADNTPGYDSAVVSCGSILGGGIAGDPAYGGPAVYIHVKASYIGPAPLKPPLAGPALAGSSGNPAVNFNYISDDGTWTVIQCDSVRVNGAALADQYCVDLNDELFTRGYMIEYYYSARDNAGVETTWPEWAGRLHAGPYCEFACLPVMNSDILYIFPYGSLFFDETDSYWQSAFDAVLPPPHNKVDRFDGYYETSVTSKQLCDFYRTIIYEESFWDMSDDGTYPHIQLLLDWMNLSEHACGLWLCGDDAAASLTAAGSSPAMELLSAWCGASLVNTSYFSATGDIAGGGVVSPLLTGDQDAGIFVHGGISDRFYAFGGCPTINDFDVLEKTANGRRALLYPTYGGSSYGAAIAATNTNAAGHPVRTMFFGFSMRFLRDDVGLAPIDRFHVVSDVLAWMQAVTNIDITPAEIPRAYALAQNYPNPFNPSTAIRYDMKDRGLVSIRIYNVAGQLVRTLVNETKEAGAYSVAWDGRNNAGAGVASGIYFYKMETARFSATKKLVMLR